MDTFTERLLLSDDEDDRRYEEYVDRKIEMEEENNVRANGNQV